MGLKVKVDQDTCTACELCYDKVPEVFRNVGDGIADVVRVDIEDGDGRWMSVSEDLSENVKDVADECPSGSIVVEEV